MRNLTLGILILIIYSTLQVLSLKAQVCPSGGGAWTNTTLQQDFNVYPGTGTVNGKYRNADGINYDVTLDWNTMTNNTGYVDDSTMKKLLTARIGEIGAINRDNYTWQVSVYYSTICYVQLKYVYDVGQTVTIECSNGNIGMEHLWEDMSGHWYFNVYQNQQCGTKCCKKVYTCTRHAGVDDHGHVVYFTTLSAPITYSVSYQGCGDPSKFIDCLTGNPIPCGSGNCN